MTKNRALAEFEDLNLSEFNPWYSPDILKYLSHLNDQGEFLRYVFFEDHNDPIYAFKEQIKSLSWLNKDFVFICKEPGAGNNHFIFGLIFAEEKKLVIINPVGETVHVGFYEAIEDISKSLKLSIYLSKTTIQKDGNSGLVSCGPICAELMLHISILSKERILEIIDRQSQSKTYAKELAEQSIELEYQSFSLVKELLPVSIQTLFEYTDQEYQGHMELMRLSHRDILESNPRLKGSIKEQNKYLDSQCINHPVQVGVFRYTQENGFMLTEDGQAFRTYLDSPISTDSLEQNHGFDRKGEGDKKESEVLDKLDPRSPIYWYSDEDMNVIGTNLLSKISNIDNSIIDTNIQFKGRVTLDLITTLFENDRNGNRSDFQEGKPVYISYNINGRLDREGGIHWISLCIIKDHNTFHALYKDSYGEEKYIKQRKDLQKKLKEEIQKINPDFELNFKIHNTKEQTDGSACGTMSLKNLEIMASYIKEYGIDDFISNFDYIEFSKQTDVYSLRKNFAYIIRMEENHGTPIVPKAKDDGVTRENSLNAEESNTEYKGYDSSEQHKKLSDNKYSIINNPGGGDCGVYTLIDAIHGGKSQYVIQEKIRSEITDTIKNFILLYSTLEEYEKNQGNHPPQEIIVDLYKNIFGQDGLRNFKFIVKNKLKVPLEDKNTNAETRASLEGKINLVNDINDWNSLREVPQRTLLEIFRLCNSLDIDVQAIINDHNQRSLQSILTQALDENTEIFVRENLWQNLSSEYCEYASKQGIWLNNSELIGYLLTQGYIQESIDLSYQDGTIIKFINNEGRIIGLFNNARDNSASNIRQATGAHWQAVLYGEDIPNDVTVPYEEEKAATLYALNVSYEAGLKYYSDNDLKSAEQEFVKVIRPILSKPLMRSLNVSEVDNSVKSKLLDAVYHLGLIYLADNSYFDHHSKAAAIFQYCAGFAKKYELSTKINEDIIGDEAYFIKQAYLVEQEFLSGVRINYIRSISEDEYYRHSYEKLTKYKNKLEGIKVSVKQKLEDISALTVKHITERARAVEDIYQESNNFFVDNSGNNQGLIQQLLADCYVQLGEPPENCQYAFISLGSLAGGKITPWSDLEFAILINKDNKEYKEYFRNLTTLLHIKVINFGETQLRSVGIESFNNFRTAEEKDDWFWDDVMNSGFSFDGAQWHACKLPFGRQGYMAKKKIKLDNGIEEDTIIKKPDFKLILTPEQMARFQSKGDGIHPDFTTDKHLVQALRSVSMIYGSEHGQDLLDYYRNEVRNATDFKEESLEILQEDSSKFALKLGDEEEGKLFDVKKDIYRLGDRIIDALANYYGVIADEAQTHLTAWQKIDIMEKELEVLSPEGAQHLREAFSISTELRLRTYSENEFQGESLSTYEPASEYLSEEQRRQLVKETFHIKDTSILHYFYYVMLRVQDVVKAFYSEGNCELLEEILSNDILFDDNYHNKGLVHARFLEYDRALYYVEVARKANPQNYNILNNLGMLYKKTGQFKKFFELANDLAKLPEMSLATSELELMGIASTLYNFSLGCYFIAEYSQAISFSQKALNIRICIEVLISTNANSKQEINFDIGASYNLLGNIHHSMGRYTEAIEFYNHSIEYYRHNLDNTSIAQYYNNLGESYRELGYYDEALNYQKIALDIRKELYKVNNPNHPDIAMSYNNLGIIYELNGDNKLANACFECALNISKKYYRNIGAGHPDIARSYNNLGIIFYKQKLYDQAIKALNKALDTLFSIYGHDSNHPDIAMNYTNLANVYSSKNDCNKAIEYYKKSLDILSSIYGHDSNHPDIAMNYTNLGISYNKQGDENQGIKYCKDALYIYYQIYEPYHLNIARCCIAMGDIYEYSKKYIRAATQYEKAQLIMSEAYRDNLIHPDIVKINLKLAVINEKNKDYKEAIKYYQKSLQSCIEMSDNIEHSLLLVEIYSHLGNVTYKANINSEVAIDYRNKALNICFIILNKEPDNNNVINLIFQNYQNLGTIYTEEGNYNEAEVCYENASRLDKSKLGLHYTIVMYNNLGQAYCNTNKYEKAIEHCKEALSLASSREDNSCLGTTYGILSMIYYRKADYTESLSYSLKALNILTQFSSILSTKFIIIESLMQLGYKCLLENEEERSLEYFAKIDLFNARMDFSSKEFIELVLKSVNFALKIEALSAVISCQLVLLKVDPELNYGNHYHNLAWWYCIKGDIELANKTFAKALDHDQVKGNLNAEYAQFLIIHEELLAINKQIISQHLYRAIEVNDNSALTYGKIDQGSICSTLRDIVGQKNTTIAVVPKTLAYYLLIKHPEYRLAEPGTEESLLRDFQALCSKFQDEVSFRLLADIYSSQVGDETLSEKYTEYASLLEQVDNFVAGRSHINKNSYNLEAVEELVNNLNSRISEAMAEQQWSVLHKHYIKLFHIYTKLLADQTKSLGEVVTNLATLSLLNNNSEQFLTLKLEYGAGLNMELVRLIGANPEEVLTVISQIEQQLVQQSQMQETGEPSEEVAVAVTDDTGNGDSKAEDVHLSGENSPSDNV